MRDVIAIAIVLGFFALAAGYVGWCERIVASDAADLPHSDPQQSDSVGAGSYPSDPSDHDDAAASPDRAVAEARS